MQDTFQHKGLRKKLVAELQQKGIQQPEVLKAILDIPRHWFVDKTFEHLAYKDIALRIDADQTISQPYTVAYQTEMLGITSGMKILEIGTGSGYQAAILHHMGAKVFTIERHAVLHKKASRQFMFLQYEAIQSYHKDGFEGLPEEAPFDRIIITAAAPEIPEMLVQQLKNKGRMVVPVNKSKNTQQMLLVQKEKNKTTIVEGPDFRFVPMLKGVESNATSPLKRLNI